MEESCFAVVANRHGPTIRGCRSCFANVVIFSRGVPRLSQHQPMAEDQLPENWPPSTFATLHQDGDDGLTVLFPVERFHEVATLMKPRRRRVLSDAERQRLREMGAKYAFQSHGTCAVCVGSP